MFEFGHSWVLIFLVIVPLILGWYFRQGHLREGTVQFSSLSLLKVIPGLSGLWKSRLLLGLRVTVIALVVLALGRPRSAVDMTETRVNVVDMLLLLDISSSMRAEDFKPNRLEAARSTASKFIRDREGDRIGLLVFAGESYIQCPLTVDYDVLQGLLSQVDIIDEQHDGTAIGMALAHGTNRLRNSTAKSKIIVLLSDGSNNAGELDPLTAAKFAADFRIKIYAVGVGTRGKAPYPVYDPVLGRGLVQVNVDMDEKTLNEVASLTGGRYFRATDEEKLAQIYEEIDQLERSEITVREYVRYRELFAWVLVPALLLAFADGFFSDVVFRRRDE